MHNAKNINILLIFSLHILTEHALLRLRQMYRSEGGRLRAIQTQNQNWRVSEVSAIIAAPIRIGESDYVCEVVVTRLEDNRFYLHEVTAHKNLHNDAFITNLAQKPASLGDLAKVLQDIVCASDLPEIFFDENGEPRLDGCE